MSTAYQVVLRSLFLLVVVGLNVLVLRSVENAGLSAVGGLALYSIAYFPLARTFTQQAARRALSGGLVLLALAAVVGITVLRDSYVVPASAVAVGVLVGCIATFPLRDTQTRRAR